MLTAILILLVIVAFVVGFTALGIRLLPGLIRAIIRKELKTMKSEITETLALARAQTSVIAGVVAFIQQHTATVDAALSTEDLDALREANEALKANTGALAQAIAVNTSAAVEVPASDGGDGGDETNIDPDNVELEAVPAAGDGEQGGIVGDQGQGGTGQEEQQQQE